MQGMLGLVEDLNTHAREIFDRLDAACGQMDARLYGLETRLSQAAERIERARGSTAALKVQSARTFQGRGAPSLRAARRVLDEDLMLSLRAAAPIPEAVDRPVPSTAAAAEDLARVFRCVNHHKSLEAPRAMVQEKLLPTAGRLSSVSELFLLNSSEQPYKVRHEVNNLAEPEDESFYHPQPGQRAAAPKASLAEHDVDLEEDEPLREHEDLRFRPRPAAEVTFDLPDVLPDLGHVAHIVWREGEHSSETARPAWDAPPAELGRAFMAGIAPKPARPPPPAPRRQPPPAPAKPAAAAQPLLAPSMGLAAPSKAEVPKPQAPQAVQAVQAPQAAQPSATPAPAPAPPKPAAKGKGKGKGKGPAPPPPPAKKAPAAKAPAPTKEAAAGKSAMFADIRAGAKLRKVAPPKERSGVVGRVV